MLGNFQVVSDQFAGGAGGIMPLLAESGGHGGPNALAFPIDLAIYTLIIFGLLLVVLGKYAWKPIVEGLDAREKSISDSIESAAKAKEEADSKLKQYEEKLAGAHDEKQTKRLFGLAIVRWLKLSRLKVLPLQNWPKRVRTRRLSWLEASLGVRCRRMITQS